MAIERTLSIIKPDAVERGLVGAIIDRFEKGGLKPVAIRLERLSEAVAGGFYAVHRERPFYRDLVAYMTSGPVVVMVLEGDNAIARNREVMGATDPAKAAAGTIRKLYAQNIERNSVPGSDAPETARTEIAYFFRATEQHAYEWRR
jgi:nucleoside-diphosphate kinase